MDQISFFSRTIPVSDFIYGDFHAEHESEIRFSLSSDYAPYPAFYITHLCYNYYRNKKKSTFLFVDRFLCMIAHFVGFHESINFCFMKFSLKSIFHTLEYPLAF